MRKRIFAIFLAVCLIMMMLPTVALADTEDSTNGTELTYVAQIGETKYQTLAGAVNAAQDGNTITLLQNTSGSFALNSKKTFTLDLGGNTLTGNITIMHGNLTLKNGTVSNENGQAISVCGSSTDQAAYSVLNIEKDAIVTGGWAICLFPSTSTNYGYGAEINIEGTINSVIFVSGNLGNDTNSANAMANSTNVSTINVKSGATITSSSQGIAMNGYSVVNVEEGASITGREAIGVKRGVLNVTGGTFVATGEKKDPAEANTNGTEETGAAISVTSTYNYAGTIKINITGGTFSSTNNSALYVGHSAKNNVSTTYAQGVSVSIEDGTFNGAENEAAVYVADAISGDATTYSKKIVSGGNFSESVNLDYLDEKLTTELYSTQKNPDAPYSYYTSVEEALKDAQPGDTIIDLSKVDEENGETGEVEFFTVTYQNGNKANTENVLASKTVTLPTLNNYGYNYFRGWTDGTGNFYQGGSTVTITADITLTAQWVYIPPVNPNPSYSITAPSVNNGTISVNPSNATKDATVTIIVTPDKDYELASLTVVDANGSRVPVKQVSDTKFTFTMPASKVTVSASFSKVVKTLPFTDVSANDYFFDAVVWAVENGVTYGNTATTFGVGVTCNRADAVTFIWRAYGCPAPKSSENPFTDVSSNAYYADAVLWAVENGITVGTSATTFSPLESCRREHIVTFLYRAAGSPTVSHSSGFVDVADSAYYANAVTWAAENGITVGAGSATTFGPTQNCFREQIVTFLYRNLAE